MLLQGTLNADRLSSRILLDNPLGDSAERELLVYLPPSYDGAKRLPMVMVLPGFGATNRSLLNYEPWQPNLVQRFERLVLEKKSKPAILVLPDAMNRWGGSQYLDSPATGNYQQYLAEEVIAWVDQHYRTIPLKQGRAVVGKSSGGFGALRLGLDYPELFSAIGSHAGDLAFDISLRPLLQRAALAFDRVGGPCEFIKQFFSSSRIDSLQFDGMLVVAFAAAYSPNRSQPLPHADFPFDAYNAELNSEVWQRWLEHDPLQRARQYLDAFRGTTLVYLDAGQHDEHGLQFGARALSQLLSARGLRVIHEEFPGGHRGTSHRYERSLPLLIDGLSDN
jgi:enterochelin esterase-like enzyme